MKNLKFYIINIAAVTLFSYILAITVSHFIRISITPAYASTPERKMNVIKQSERKSFNDYYNVIQGASFFREAVTDASSDSDTVVVSSDLRELKLLGTITGPSSIARALIRKRTEKKSEIFKLKSDVYGFKLLKIGSSKITLQKGDSKQELELYSADEPGNSNNFSPNQPSPFGATMPPPSDTPKSSYSVSRSEIQQKVFGNIDNALNGIRAGPQKENNEIVGYKLFRVSPSNIAYKYGMRSGDIIKRVNGHAVNSTEKLLGIWESVKTGESRVTMDIERNGKIETVTLNITD